MLQMIEYFRLHIEYLWNAVNLKKTEHCDSLNIKFSIINSQFRLVRVRDRLINTDIER